jgi:beta-mannosidase
VLSWSVLDYHGFGKAGYYYARRAYSPILTSFKTLPDGGVELWMTNDTLETITDDVLVRLAGFDGGIFWEEALPIRAPANASLPVARWNRERVASDPGRYLSVASANGRFPKNRLFFEAIKDLDRAPSEPEVGFETIGDHELRVTLRAPAYAYFVNLEVPDEATRYSDNFFDLEPGEARTISVTNARRPLRPETVAVRWR